MTQINNDIVEDTTAANELKELSTPQLWDRVGSAHSEFENVRRTMASGLRTCAQQALLLGECLTILQQRTPAGTWIATVEQNCGIGIREVQRYQQLYDQREALAAIDPQWQTKFTITEALEELRLTSIEQSQKATKESRSARKKARAQSSEEQATSYTEAGNTDESGNSSAAGKRSEKGKGKTTRCSAKECFRHIVLGTRGVRVAVQQVAKAKQLDQLQQRIVEARDECEALLQECARKRQEIEAAKGNPTRAVSEKAKKPRTPAKIATEVPFIGDTAQA